MRKREGKRPLGKTRHKLKDNIKMDLQEMYRVRWKISLWLRIGTGGGHL
jgi:hypothetical protein